jgi:hypothetical protein
MQSVVAGDKIFVTPQTIGTRFALVLIILTVIASTWFLATLRSDGWPMVHSDAVLFLPAASSIADGEGFNFSVYTRLYLAREPHSWALDLHGQVYPWLLAQLARSSDYLDLINATGVIAAATVLLGFFAMLLRLRAEQWSTGMAWLTAAAVALSAGMFSCAYAGRPEQLVPMICLAFAGWRAHPGLRHSSLSFGAEVGVIAACTPAPAVLAGLLYLNWLLLSSKAAQLPQRCIKLALASVLTWALAVTLVSPYAAIDILLNTFVEFSSASVGSPVGRRFALEMLILRSDLPWIGLSWLLLGLVMAWCAQRQSLPLWQRAVFCLVAGLTLLVFYRVGLERYTAQYTFASLGVIAVLLSANLIDLAAPSVRSLNWWRAALLLAAAPPAFGFIYWSARENENHAVGDSRSAIMVPLAQLLANAAPADRFVVKDGDAPIFVLEARPNRMLSVIDLTSTAIAQTEQALNIKARWLLLPTHLPPTSPTADYRYVTSFGRDPARRDWQPAGYGVHVFERID